MVRARCGGRVMVRRFLLGLLVAALASPDMAKARCSSLEPVRCHCNGNIYIINNSRNCHT